MKIETPTWLTEFDWPTERIGEEIDTIHTPSKVIWDVEGATTTFFLLDFFDFLRAMAKPNPTARCFFESLN